MSKTMLDVGQEFVEARQIASIAGMIVEYGQRCRDGRHADASRLHDEIMQSIRDAIQASWRNI